MTLVFSFRRKHRLISESLESIDDELIFNPDIESRLFALEEANKFFGASLKSSDMFRLITSRVNEIVPFESSVLFLVDDARTRLKISLTVGKNSRELTDFVIPLSKGLAGKVFLSGKTQMDGELSADINVIGEDFLKGLTSAIAVPLYRDADIYGVLELFGDETISFDKNSIVLLDAVGERVAPLLLSSFTFEQNISNAMTDALTSFPNERAFYLVLENQIAESQRYHDERSLTILSVDIKDFAELNQKYGHIAGDQVLYFAAALIKKQLRQMDFLARSLSDEFLIILPTATDEITKEIIQRLKSAFANNPFEVSDEIKEKLRLNFGAATFMKDGETANQLLEKARIHKQELKLKKNGKIINFPKGFAK